MAGVGGIPFEKSSGFVISIPTTTFSAKFFSPYVVIALGVSSHRVAIPTISPNAAAPPRLLAVESYLAMSCSPDLAFSRLLKPLS
jgi:hypothetical protein